MKKPKSQPTFLVRQGNRIKEYTPGRIAKKLQSGDLSPDNLAHNRDGVWRALHATPGFRRICKAAILGRPSPGEPKIKPALSVSVSKDQPKEGRSAEENPSHFMENLTVDILNKEIPPFTKEASEGTEVSNPDLCQKQNATVTPIIPGSTASIGSQVPEPVKAPTNPYANRQYFRVRKADPVEVNPKQTTDLVAIFLSSKGKWITAGLVSLAGLYFSGQFLMGGKKTDKPLVSGQQLSLLVNPDQEKTYLAQGHGRGVTEKDRKFMESFRKSYMEHIKHQ